MGKGGPQIKTDRVGGVLAALWHKTLAEASAGKAPTWSHKEVCEGNWLGCEWGYELS